MKFTPEDYTRQWVAARFSGRVEFATKLLTAAKGTYSDALDTKILEALDLDWKDQLNSSEESLRLWKGIKRASEAESHTCLPPHPCRVCCDQAFTLLRIAFRVEAYNDAIEQADKLLALTSNDDIIALFLRANARMELAFTKTEEEIADELIPVLADLERASELTTKLPDDKIHHLKSDRDHPESVAKKNKNYRLLQMVQDMIIGEEQDTDLTGPPFGVDAFNDILTPVIGGESMPVDAFNDILTLVIGGVLIALDRSEEGLPLWIETFEAAREAGDREMVVIFGIQIGYTFLKASEPNAAAALPYLTESLASATDDEEREYAMLASVAECLLHLEEQADLKRRDKIKSTLRLLETKLERARHADDTPFIDAIVYIIGIVHSRLGQSDKALPYFIESLMKPDEIVLKFFIEGLSDLKQRADLKQRDEIKSTLWLLEAGVKLARHVDDTSLIHDTVFIVVIMLLKEIIGSPVFTALDEHIQIEILNIFSGCLAYLKPRRAAALIQQLVEWAAEDE